MIAGKHDFVIEQGAIFSETVTYLDSSGDPVDLTGYKAEMNIRTNKADTSTIVKLLSTGAGASDGTITLGGAAGTLVLYIKASLTRAMTLDRAYYDIELSPGGTDPNTADDTIRLLEGVITLSKEATKD